MRTRVSKRNYALFLLIAAVFDPSHVRAQAAIDTTVPNDIRYIFDLPWCKTWNLTCLRCEKRNDQILCERLRENCQEKFDFYHCVQFNLPEGCIHWRNGCNACAKTAEANMYCTMRPCKEYTAPNRPTFECLDFEHR